MFSKVKQFFQKKEPNPDDIRDFSDALEWIKNRRRVKDYHTAIIASKELILKHEIGINYYENAWKKVAVLESSNIVKIAEKAKDKRKKIDDIVVNLYKETSDIQKLLKKIENEYSHKQAQEEQRAQKERFKIHSQEIKDILKRNEFLNALSHAKKLVSEFPNERWALQMLTKTQKLYDKDKLKQENESLQKDKIKNILQEAGVEMSDMKKQNNTISIMTRFTLFLKKIRQHIWVKREKQKREKALQDIERLLLRSGTIDNIEEDNSNQELLSVMSTGLTKDISDFSLYGYDFFGKIHGKDKIVWDTFGYFKEGSKTVFYIGDATGHGVQAGFTVALLSKIFFEFSKKIKNFSELFVTLNNELKLKLKGRIFVTSVFFELDATNNSFSFIGAGHDPMLLYRKKTNTVEKIIPGWLALGVRIIQNISSVKMHDIKMEDGDVLFGYTDGIMEAKNMNNEMYWLVRMEGSFKKHAAKFGHNPKKIYELMLQEVNEYRGTMPFQDDVSFFFFSRNTTKDIISNKGELESMLQEMDIKKTDAKDINYTNKTKQQIMEDVKKERHERELKIRLSRLDRLYDMAEFTKLKQEIYLYFREWYIHDKMRFYLEKALENEQKSIIKKQDEKLKRKYELLQELYKKWEYELVIQETMDVLFKNGKI